MSRFKVGDLVVPSAHATTLEAVKRYLKIGMPYRITRLDHFAGIHLQERDGTDVPKHDFWNPNIFILYQEKTFSLSDTGE